MNTNQASPSQETNKNKNLKKAASEYTVPRNGVGCYYENQDEFSVYTSSTEPKLVSLHIYKRRIHQKNSNQINIRKSQTEDELLLFHGHS
jgi:hypothetical protein